MRQGFVYIVESPSPIDLLDDRREGYTLRESLRVSRVAGCYYLAVNRETFELALTARIQQALQNFRTAPVIHISAHGCEDGIVLTDGMLITWRELRALLQPLHDLFAGGLIVGLSACQSYAGMQMAMYDEQGQPFMALVSHMASPTWAKAALGFSTFYQRFFDGLPIDQCLNAMRAGAHDGEFCVWQGEKIRADWLARTHEKVLAGMPPAPAPAPAEYQSPLAAAFAGIPRPAPIEGLAQAVDPDARPPLSALLQGIQIAPTSRRS